MWRANIYSDWICLFPSHNKWKEIQKHISSTINPIQHMSHDQNLGACTIKNQVQYPRSKSRSMHESKPIVGSATAEQRSNCVFLPQLGSATVVSSEWEWVSFGSESEFWSVLGCVFYLFGVRVMENIEVGYGALTVRIISGQSIKI